MSTLASSQDLSELHDTAKDLLFREARTANSFTDEPVTDEQLQAIYDLVKWAPTSANTQPLRMLVLRSPEAKARLAPLMSEGNRAKTAAAPAVAILAADTEFHEYIPRLFPLRPEFKDNFADPAMRESFARFNATLQIGYFILAIRAVGLVRVHPVNRGLCGCRQDLKDEGGICCWGRQQGWGRQARSHRVARSGQVIQDVPLLLA